MKLIAFYLPQFYAFPENDKWWGKGFTEWTNVKKSKPLYKGHYQPTIPLNHNFYTLDNIEVIQWQVNIAKQYGVFGFCFYHYWFGEDRILMEKPVELFLNHPEIDFPFCLSWANHNWTKTWNGGGGEKELLMDMRYGDKEEWEKHFDYLLPFFMDKRYIQVDGKPVLVIYLPQDIPCLNDMLMFLQKRAIESGLNGLTIISQAPLFDEKVISAMDYCIEYEPNYSRRLSNSVSLFEYLIGRNKGVSHKYLKDSILYRIKERIKKITKSKLCKVITYDYDAIWEFIVSRPFANKKMISGAFVNCDVTPRRQDRAQIYKGATPLKFANYMKQLVSKVQNQGNIQIIFISAWNEWGEGMYLEPDEKNGYGYLEGVKNAIM